MHSDRDLLHTVFMMDDSEARISTPRDGTFSDHPLTQRHPTETREFPPDGILLDHPVTYEEHIAWMSSWSHLRKPDWVLEQRRRRHERGTVIESVPGVHPYQSCMPSLALATNTGTVVPDRLTILMDIGSNINICGLKTAQDFETKCALHGLTIKKSNIKPALYVSGVGSGAAVCNTTGEFPIGVAWKRGPQAGQPASSTAGQPAQTDLQTFTTAIAEGSGELLPCLLYTSDAADE